MKETLIEAVIVNP